MDGAVVLSNDGSRIVRANVQLVPDPTIPTDESGTRHRSAERTAIQTGYPVISVSHSMNLVTIYVAGERHVVADSATILSRANQAIATLERYKARLDEVSRQLSTAEIEDFVTLRDVMTVVQRLEMVRRIGLEIDYDAVELGHRRPPAAAAARGAARRQRHRPRADRARLPRQPRTAVEGSDRHDPGRTRRAVRHRAARLHRAVAGVRLPLDRRSAGLGAAARGATGRWPVIPRLQFAHVDLLVRRFGSLQGLLAASATDLQSVDGIGAMWARHVREGLSQLAESTIADRLV